MDHFLPLGHETLDTTQPSMQFEGHATPRTFVEWALENGVTQPRLAAEKFADPPGSDVAERRLPGDILSDRYRAVHVWMSTHRQVRPIDLIVAALLFVVIAFATAQLLAPAPPSLPPLR